MMVALTPLRHGLAALALISGATAFSASSSAPRPPASDRPAQLLPAAPARTLTGSFSMEIDGVNVAGVHTIEIKSLGNLPTDGPTLAAVRDCQSHSRSELNRIVIVKDWSNTLEWYTWRRKTIDGILDERSVSVIFHDQKGAETGRQNFYRCVPVKHTLPSFNAKNSGHATETIELVGAVSST